MRRQGVLAQCVHETARGHRQTEHSSAPPQHTATARLHETQKSAVPVSKGETGKICWAQCVHETRLEESDRENV